MKYFTKIYQNPIENLSGEELTNFKNDIKLMVKLYYSYTLLMEILNKIDSSLFDDYKIDIKILCKQYIRICDDIDDDEEEDVIFNKICDLSDSVLLIVEKIELSYKNEILKSSFRLKLSNEIIQINNNPDSVMNMEISKLNEIFLQIQSLVTEV